MCLDCIAMSPNDGHHFVVSSYCNLVQTMAIAVMMIAALMMRCCRIVMMDVAEIVMKIAMVYLSSHRIVHANWNVCANVPDDSRTKLERVPLLVWFFVPILRANKHPGNDFWQKMLRALAIVHLWMWYAICAVCVSMINRAQNQFRFRSNCRHHRMMNHLFCKFQLKIQCARLAKCVISSLWFEKFHISEIQTYGQMYAIIQ